MPETNKNPFDVNRIVTLVGKSNEYRLARDTVEGLDLTDGNRRKTAIQMAATALKGEHESGYLTPEGHAMNITAQLTSYTESAHRLDTLQSRGATYKEKLPLRQKMAEFNHAIKDMVDSNPALRYSEVLSFLRDMNQVINGRDGAAQFEHTAQGILTGMRHEIAVEQMLRYMTDVEYKEATIDEDLKGADLFVSLNGSEMTRIDIKASDETARMKRQRASRDGYNPYAIVWSHVTELDFSGGFRISHETAEAKAPHLHADLMKAVRSRHTQRQRTS